MEKQIGVGGMGVVYLATYPKTGKRVAVKILSPGLMADKKLLSRFEREIDILKRLDHPNIVKYYGGGTENNQRYYAMQFIDGGSLQDILKKRGRLTWEQAIHVGRQVCSALEHAHNAGIVHRDLKPANLFLSKKGRLMLGDFGIARDTEATALTAAGKTVGTYAYMAPEQIQGGHPISRKTDIYALGCLLFEVLTGRTPFEGDNPAEMLMQHLNDHPPNVSELAPDCPVWLDRLIERMLEKNPDDRPFDALAVHTELGEIRDRIAAGNSVVAQTVAAADVQTAADKQDLKKLARKKKRKKKKDGPFHESTWFLASCLIALVGVTVWLLLPPGEECLFEDAEMAMTEGDEIAQREALERYILPSIERFPEGRHVGQMRIWADMIRVDKLEAQLEKKAKGFGEMENEYEAQYVIARKQQSDPEVNPLQPIETYHSVIVGSENILAAENSAAAENSETAADAGEDVRLYLVLFGKRLREAREKLLSDEQCWQIFRSRMEEAEKLAAGEDPAAAESIWFHTMKLFGDEPSVKPFWTYARDRLNGQTAEIPGDDQQPVADDAESEE